TGMLATAKHHGWSLTGYERAGHPQQDRLLDSVAQWTGLERGEIVLGVDGCTTVCYGMPLRAMALAYARFAVADDPAPRRLYRAMTEHPELVAGTHRLCTDLMRAWEGALVAKIGAEGVYSAALPSLRLGIAIKVMDGDLRSVGIALLSVLRQVLERSSRYNAAEEGRFASLTTHAEPVVRHTRGGVVGGLRGAGELQFF
ncbi:MAG: asparaginase, partial [Gemmatimonadales bacterium]